MSCESEEHWKGGVDHIWDCHFDKFMCDYEIREFLRDTLGFQSWDDLNEDMRKCCYKFYPKRNLPDWNMIVTKSY